MTDKLEAAIERLRAYAETYPTMSGLDPNLIHSIWAKKKKKKKKKDGPLELHCSDIVTVLDALAALPDYEWWIENEYGFVVDLTESETEARKNLPWRHNGTLVRRRVTKWGPAEEES